MTGPSAARLSPDARLTEAELSALRDAPTERAWNDVCKQIQSARGLRTGQYPSSWYEQVINPGLSSKPLPKQ